MDFRGKGGQRWKKPVMDLGKSCEKMGKKTGVNHQSLFGLWFGTFFSIYWK
jgi:hypothetical protein